ncbi:hypothetical protein HHI36_020509 [Cryptolaemus montrouzieri]|uniref:Major facilitator superfamily (MFS) profile domain-containing protein n=1 Tax=Cryptolaemus montrouzieri TaxID=559131 RepID=A0ABD2NBM2_9CUCU
MLKARVSRVVFSSGIAPSESEYFDEINAYKKKTWWLLLLFLSRTMIPIAKGVQASSSYLNIQGSSYRMTYYSIINDVEGTCYVPELSNNNWTFGEIENITKKYGFELAKELDRCEYFAYNYSVFFNKSYLQAYELKKTMGRHTVLSCAGKDILLSLHSSKYHTVNTPFCHAKEFAKKMVVLKTTSYTVGSIFFGVLGDLFGRRKVSIIVAVLWATCALLLALAPNLDMSQVFYSASCCFFVAADFLTYVNLLEICHKKIRFFTVLTLYGYIAGFIVCTRFADHLHFSWLYLQYISFCFTLIAVFHCWYVPESPRWLINKSKYKGALKVMEEIIGYVPNEILFEDEGSETPFSFKTIGHMCRYLRKRKLKIITILGVMNTIIGFVNETQVWRLMHTKYPLKATIVAASADLLSLPYILIIYAAFGKKYGLFWTFIFLNVTSFITLCLKDIRTTETNSSAIVILNAVTAQKFVYIYLPDLMPTFLRCTGIGIAATLSSIARTITVQFINWEEATKNYIYLIFLIFSLPGFFVLKLPDTTHADLPTTRLFRV